MANTAQELPQFWLSRPACPEPVEMPPRRKGGQQDLQRAWPSRYVRQELLNQSMHEHIDNFPQSMTWLLGEYPGAAIALFLDRSLLPPSKRDAVERWGYACLDRYQLEYFRDYWEAQPLDNPQYQ